MGFRIKIVECDGAFRSSMEEASDGLHADMNWANAGEHAPRAERNNQTMKDSFRRACLGAPCERTSRAMIETLGEITAERSNMFQAKKECHHTAVRKQQQHEKCQIATNTASIHVENACRLTTS